MTDQKTNVVNIKNLDITKINTKNVNLQFGGLSEDKTYLHHAVDNNDLEVVKMLLKAGADVNLANSHNYTPLTLAIKHLEYRGLYNQKILKQIIQELINAL